MNMQQVRDKARTYGIKVGKSKKVELIKTIQDVEGNIACFGTSVEGICDQAACLWRDDCLEAPKKRAVG